MRADEMFPEYGSPEWEAMLEVMAAKQFKLAATEPWSWLSQATNLKRAADHIFEIYYIATMRRVEEFLADAGPREPVSHQILEGQELEDLRDGDLISVYFLLMGYSLENLLKGILLNQNPDYFKPSGKMNEFNSHDLVSLCARIGLPLDDEERDWLTRLTAYIKWQGKYPVPLQFEDDRDRSRGIPFKQRDFQDELGAIWEKIALRLREEARRGR